MAEFDEEKMKKFKQAFTFTSRMQALKDKILGKKKKKKEGK
tara:strand:+ start:13897 stop:14019 length:123 start_codon:yes stop_codon:yes gene_type:complete